MTTEALLMESARVRATVASNEVMLMLAVVLSLCVLALVMEYVYRRWTWIPRRKHNRVYRERF